MHGDLGLPSLPLLPCSDADAVSRAPLVIVSTQISQLRCRRGETPINQPDRALRNVVSQRHLPAILTG